MVSLINLVDLLEAELPEHEIYPLEFPLKSGVVAITVNMETNTVPIADVFPLNVQCKVRADHPTTGEALSYRIRNFLNEKTNFTLGNMQVVMVQSQNPVPLYVGKDNDGNYLYSNNFIFKMNEGGNK